MTPILDKRAARAAAKKEQAIIERQEKAARYDALTADRPAGDRWVSMSNALTRAAHGLTLGEKRIIMAAVSKLDSFKRPTPGQPVPTTKITAAEYAELAECEPNAAYEALQTAAKNLYRRSIVIFEPSFKRGPRKIGDKGTVTHMRWCGEARYHDKEAWIEISWWHEVVPHLMGLRKNFTTYQLQQASALRSVYSWRLLELLMRFKSTGKAEYTIEDFCTSMEATPKQRGDFAAVRRKIIEPAVKELQEKDGWLIQWMPVKAGRKVKALAFNFMRNPQAQIPGLNEEPTPPAFDDEAIVAPDEAMPEQQQLAIEVQDSPEVAAMRESVEYVIYSYCGSTGIESGLDAKTLIEKLGPPLGASLEDISEFNNKFWNIANSIGANRKKK